MTMTPGKGAAALEKFKRFSSLKDGLPEERHIESGIANALHDLWACNGIHPARLAALALEDANHHDDAATLFYMSTKL